MEAPDQVEFDKMTIGQMMSGQNTRLESSLRKIPY